MSVWDCEPLVLAQPFFHQLLTGHAERLYDFPHDAPSSTLGGDFSPRVVIVTSRVSPCDRKRGRYKSSILGREVWVGCLVRWIEDVESWVH